MHKLSPGFSLIELLIGVSISTIIMISVGAFTLSGMKNITLQKNILNQKKEIDKVQKELYQIFSGPLNIITQSNSGIHLQTSHILGKASFYDIFTTPYASGNCTYQSLSIKNYNPVSFKNNIYSGSFITQQIYSGSTLIGGNGNFGEELSQTNALSSPLNNPSGFAKVGNTLFFSDSGNHSISYISGGILYPYLNYKYNIYFPSGLVFGNNTLFAINTGNNELLAIKSIPETLSSTSLSFTSATNITFNSLDIDFGNLVTLSGTYQTGSFLFSDWSTTPSDGVTFGTHTIRYGFNTTQTIIAGQTYSLDISPLSGDFLNTGVFPIGLTFLDNSLSVQGEKFIPYKINSDTDIATLGDNDIKVISKNLDGWYSDISFTGSNLLLNDYVNKQYLILSQNGSFISSGSILDTNIPDFENTLTEFDLKIHDIKVNTTQNILTIIIQYYQNFNCENPDENVIKTLIIKKAVS